MRIWFDTEFIEDGRTIDLLSIGMIREDGRSLYMQNADCAQTRANDWVRAHVLPKLDSQYEPKRIIKEIVREFAGRAPEFWADYAAYDWIALCQLFGTMMELPHGWPMFCRDFQQLIDVPWKRSPDEPFSRWQPTLIAPELEHHALNDALWLRDQHLAFEQRPIYR